MRIYLRDLEDLERHVQQGTGEQFEDERGLANITNSVVDAAELVEIHTGLKNREDPILKKLLVKYVRGTDLRSAETPLTTEARNYGFHLWFAATAGACDIPIQLTPPADVLIRPSSYSVAVECKRLFSATNVGKNVSKAFSQLRSRYETHTGSDDSMVLSRFNVEIGRRPS
jgi:hypothetical protein